ncbi:hypothetical protein DRN45_04550 [Thermococci archaeon]|nr:MAG: hypothetical protein DRN45_04550 [Thermococci archaeon]
MIIHKKIQGWNEKDIAIALKISVRTVRRWWRGYERKDGVDLKSSQENQTYS